MNLTKEQAIEEHRKMWNWIADQLENGRRRDVGYLKEEYVKENFPVTEISDNCFCCEYAKYDCSKCPVLWGCEDEVSNLLCEHGGIDERGLWWKAQMCSLRSDYVEAAEIARQIANLPEKG